MKNYKLLILWAVLVFFGCKKNENDENPDSNNFKNRKISSIIVDNSNTVWAGTDTGLYKSQGNSFVFENTVVQIEILSLSYEEKTNLLWIGTSNGLIKATISNNGITADIISPENLKSNKIQASYIDSASRSWFGLANGVTLNKKELWKTDSFVYNTRSNKYGISDLEKLSINSISSWDGDYYFATNGAGLYRASVFKDSLDAFTGATQWENPENGKNITSTMFVVFVDSKGNQWMGGEKGIQVHTGHLEKLPTSFTYYNSELADQMVHAIAEAPDGKMWVGTEKGLSILNGTSWTTRTEGLPDLFVTAIAFDRNDGSAWIGTKKGIVNLK
jgi:ligand-binding sensor domain-containing protein